LDTVAPFPLHWGEEGRRGDEKWKVKEVTFGILE
jgi:hypothetical protein